MILLISEGECNQSQKNQVFVPQYTVRRQKVFLKDEKIKNVKDTIAT